MDARFKHGHSRRSKITRTWHTWSTMRQRCENPKSAQFKNYGGRGIVVSTEWQSFDVFLRDMGEKPNGLQIDRIDNDGPYSKANCRWATPKQNSSNRRNTKIISACGFTGCLADAAKHFGLSSQVILNRIAKGHSTESALLTPIDLVKSRAARRVAA